MRSGVTRRRRRVQESTRSVELLRQSTREQQGGVQLYDFEYQLDSTRGLKRILNTVTITAATLFIVNGQHKCGRDGCTDDDEAAIAALRASMSTFQVR